MMDPSRKQSFEEHWKKAFDEASVPPPNRAWENIEARLDLGAAEPAFEDQWKQAFDQASVELPVGAWEGIEERLEKDDKIRIVPLWWQSPRTWFAAASVAAVLLVGGVWMKSFQGEDVLKKDADFAVRKETVKPSVATEPLKSRGNGSVPSREETNVAALDPGHTSEKAAAEKLLTKRRPAPAGKQSIPSIDQSLVAQNRTEHQKAIQITAGRPESSVKENDVVKGLAVDGKMESNFSNIKESGLNAGKGELFDGEVASARPNIQVELIPVSPHRNLDVFMQQRYVFYQEKEEPVTPLVKKHQEYWAGVGLMPASFNPDVNLKTAPSTFQTQSYSSQKSVTGKNDPGFSYAVQTQGGVRISKHWSVETGVSFLRGNSNYEGGGYVLDASSNGFSNVLENALADVTYANKGFYPSNSLAAGLVNNAVYIDVSKQVRNDYRYVQLPVQAGFTLNPDGRLSYSVLGGMMANFFVNNELESANGNVITTTASDEVYRGLNWAATTGLRFNYRISGKWRAMLTGSYQKAVTSGFRSNQNLESHPYLYGVSWGMRYSF